MGTREQPGQGYYSQLIVFFSYGISDLTGKQLRMIYASTVEQLKRALNLGSSIHADNSDEIEWDTLLRGVSGGRAQ